MLQEAAAGGAAIFTTHSCWRKQTDTAAPETAWRMMATWFARVGG